MKHFYLASFILLTAFAANAQRATVRGTVLDRASGEPVIFTNVLLLGTQYGAQTDENGFYSIPSVPAGSYTLFCTYLGYDTFQLDITLKDNDLVTQKIVIGKQARSLQNVVISARREEKTTETKVSVTQITPKEIKKLPGIGGEADLAQYLQVIPGVVFTGDQGGELYIRGGSPIQTKMLLDGMTLHNPFHSIGLFSVYETELIKNIDVYTGGFNAEYGGRLSAVVDVQTRDGNKKRFGGKVAVNPFQSKLILEGPIKKFDESTNGSASYIVTGKTSYLDQSSKILYPNVGENGLPYSYTDLFGKVSMNSGNGSKLSLFGFRYDDNVKYENVSEFGWTAFGGGTNFVVIPGTANTLISGAVSFSDYEILIREGDGEPRSSGINGFDLITDITYFLREAQLKYGVNIGGYKTKFRFTNALGNNIDQDQNTTELSGFVVYKKTTKHLVIEPSFRLQYYASLPAVSPEPRLSVKVNVTDNFRLKAATGFYSQNFISTKSDQDVVNLFTGFLTAPEGQLEGFDDEDVTNNLQRAFHAVGGIEYDFTEYLEFNVEPYYKKFTQLVSLNRNKLLPSDPDFQIEKGDAYGLDLLAKYDHKNLYVWLGYSLGFVTRDNGAQVYPPHYDRRHNANAVVSYSWGRNQSWEASVRWNIGSGFPFTKTQGFYEQLPFEQGIYTNYTQQNGVLGIVYDDSLNTGRLPFYHRLDVSLRKTFNISERIQFEVNGSLINAYNRENIFYFDRVRYTRVNQLPILPALGMSLSF